MGLDGRSSSGCLPSLLSLSDQIKWLDQSINWFDGNFNKDRSNSSMCDLTLLVRLENGSQFSLSELIKLEVKEKAAK